MMNSAARAQGEDLPYDGSIQTVRNSRTEPKEIMSDTVSPPPIGKQVCYFEVGIGLGVHAMDEFAGCDKRIRNVFDEMKRPHTTLAVTYPAKHLTNANRISRIAKPTQARLREDHGHVRQVRSELFAVLVC